MSEFTHEDAIATFRCCLAQSGNPVTFSAIGGGQVKLDFSDDERLAASDLILYRDTPLYVVIFADPDGKLIQRRGRPKKQEQESG